MSKMCHISVDAPQFTPIVFYKLIISGYNIFLKGGITYYVTTPQVALWTLHRLLSFWENQGCPILLLPCCENWNTLHSCSHCLRAAQVNSCNSVFPKDNNPKPVGFSLHLCPFNLNSTCFGFVNWLCSLWPQFCLFTLHTWELILFLLDLHPV